MAPDTGITVAAALRDGRARLAPGSETARLDARLLLQHATGLTHAEIIGWPEHRLGAAEAAGFARMLERRAAGEPVAQITGIREFWGMPFRVTADTLCPRPDSETLIDLALSLCVERRPASIADLGTGTGCLLAALLSEFPAARGMAVDLSPAALAVAAENFATLALSDRVELVEADFGDLPALRADLVITNPPYIPTGDRAALPVEVRDHEPALALFAGDDGLDAYRVLSHVLPVVLTEGGSAVIEAGDGQAGAVETLMKAGFATAGRDITISTKSDLGGHVRAVGLTDIPGTGTRHG